MTSKEFIDRQFGNDDGQTKTLSSIFKDEKGNIYSYGRHYPLLFQVGELTFRNVVGYSNTTAKHINWAGGHGAIDVWLDGTNLYSWQNPENRDKVPYLLAEMSRGYMEYDEQKLLKAVFADLEAELVDINKRIASKTRTDTKLYAALLEERSDCVDRIAGVRPYLGAK